ncbi:transportin-3 [Coccinella septempunctata]|uniref:transportin-3 n=1 Tax=Coccinella septempunctata TaxID=41139 RepID=UPI001D0881A1|nr:transportin-3 [Coccinella septempunctata]
MEEKPSLDIVYLAISALFDSKNASENEKAAQWLDNLQKSVYAWTIADEILHRKKDLQSCCFAAQTMRSKILNSFHELPLDAHTSLRDSLVEHISQVDENTNSAIVRQLCLALADLALQMTSWKRAPLDLIGKFSQTNVWPLLEILTVLPEEIEKRSIRLGENRRLELIEEFKQCAATIEQFLQHCCNHYAGNFHENIQVNITILCCFTSWVSIGAILLQNAHDNIIIIQAFHILDAKNNVSGPLHDAATNCICMLLQCLEEENNYLQLETFLFNNIVQLEVSYHLSVANEDQDKSKNFCKIFSELAESFLEKIIKNSTRESYHYAIKALDLVLMCVGHHDYEVADLTFSLWYVLSEELYHKNSKESNELFKPFVERLITALCRHSQIEPDHEGLLKDNDEFKYFRSKASDLIKDVVFIVGSSNCFRQMFLNLQNPNATWDQSEASLFVMQSVAKNILPDENEVVPQVVEAILSIQDRSTHVAVRYTSLMLLGELCEWVEKHPNTLDPILHYLVSSLPQPDIGPAAAEALQNICTTCGNHMAKHMPFLLQILHQVDKFCISNDAIMGLLKGVAAIIGYMPPNDIVVAFREICFIPITPLVQLIEQDTPTSKGTKSDPVIWLDRLSSILRSVSIKQTEDGPHPCKSVVLEIWPLLSKSFDKYQSDGRIMERCCRCMRFMLRCVSQQLAEILQSLVHQIVVIYSNYKHSCLLYVGSILVDEYATDIRCIQGLLDMMNAFLEPTFRLFQENGLVKHPDTVDDFFRLCARFIQRAPIPFLQSAALSPILQCALTACSLVHKEANTSVMKFLYDVISTGHLGKKQSDWTTRNTLVRSILNQFGQQLVTNLIHASVFYLHSYMLCEISDVIVELLEFDRQVTREWLANALETLPKQDNGSINAATPQQLKEIHTNISKSDTSKAITHALKDLTRYYR